MLVRVKGGKDVVLWCRVFHLSYNGFEVMYKKNGSKYLCEMVRNIIIMKLRCVRSVER